MEQRARACLAVGLTLGMSELGVLSLLVDRSGVSIRKVAARWGREMVGRLDIDLRVKGGEDVDWSKPVVVMANHNSLLDIPILYASLPRSFGMLAKSGLFKFPVFGRAMTGVGCVAIDRANKSSAHAAIQKAAAQVRAGDGIVVFPEGTRGNGEGVRPFKMGPFHLAQAAGVQIVPVGLRGTAAVCPRDQFRIIPGVVDVTIGKPVLQETSTNGASKKPTPAQRTRLADTVRVEIARLAGLPLVAE